jgi:uncharacterized protein YaeQ
MPFVAQGATIYNFNIDLSDLDRNIYEALNLRVALHPSEAVDHMLVRVLAYCLEYQDGISFSKGLAEADEPAVWVHDRTGALLAWIDVGAPASERLHRAAKLAGQVAVYTHKDIDILKHNLGRKTSGRIAQIPLYVIEPAFLAALEALLERRVDCRLSVQERQLYLDINGRSLQTAVVEHHLGE